MTASGYRNSGTAVWTGDDAEKLRRSNFRNREDLRTPRSKQYQRILAFARRMHNRIFIMRRWRFIAVGVLRGSAIAKIGVTCY